MMTSAALGEPAAVLHRFDPAGAAARPVFDFIDPQAPKGGTLRLGVVGVFDSLNPFTLGGIPSNAVDYTLDPLTLPDPDDPMIRHCLVCETVELGGDRAWIEFVLRAEARFHDGAQILADDVRWTIDALAKRGHPYFRVQLAGIRRAEARDGRTIRVHFTDNPPSDLPMMVASIPVLSRRWWSGRDISAPNTDPPLGSGPYRIEFAEAGRVVVLERVPTYWGADHALQRGRFNFDVVRIHYFRDEVAAREAFLAGDHDIRFEGSAAAWATTYDARPVRDGRIQRIEVAEDRVSGMQGYVINTRRSYLADRRVRLAIIHAFDFEWTNRVLLHGAYERTRSFFNNGRLAADGAPTAEETALLSPWRGDLPADVFGLAYEPPRNAGDGNWRANRRMAHQLLAEAGYTIDAGRLVDHAGRALALEILLADPQHERLTLPFAANLRQLGIVAQVRTVDSAQYQKRLERFDFDLTLALFGQSEAPGVEQRQYWSSAYADVPGSLNLAGVRDAAVDSVIEAVIAAPDMPALVARTRALDRLLRWGAYVVPLGHSKIDRVAFWNRFGRPSSSPRSGVDVMTWWLDPIRDKALAEGR